MRHHNPALPSLFSVDDADRLLTSSPLAVPHYAVLGATDAMASSAWHRPVINPQTGLADAAVIDPAGALRAFDDGATVILYELRAWSAVIDGLAASLEAELGHRVGVNAYLTAPDTRGLPHHYDPHDVVIVQMHGSKRWSISEPAVDNPTAQHMPDRNGNTTVVDELTMTPGDVLYVPRGWPHATSTHEQASLHLTIAVVPITRGDLLEMVVRSCIEDPAMRSSLPVGFHNDVDVTQAAIADTLALLSARVASLEGLQSIVEELVRAARPRRYTQRGNLAARLAAVPGADTIH